MHNISNLFYFGTALYMFRTVYPSIIRSLRLYIQHQVYVWYRFCGCLLSSTLHVSDGLSVHHQESKTVHTASGICLVQVLWLLAGKQPQTCTRHIPDAVCTVLDSWWWTERPSETCRVLFQNKINLRYCASGWSYYRNMSRSYKRQISPYEICAWCILTLWKIHII